MADRVVILPTQTLCDGTGDLAPIRRSKASHELDELIKWVSFKRSHELHEINELCFVQFVRSVAELTMIDLGIQVKRSR